MDFAPFTKISRLSREMIVTEKIDGTNGIIHIGTYGGRLDEILNWGMRPVYTEESPDGTICLFAGSRTRWITPQDDNHGFAKWVQANASELMMLGEGVHYGEWWGRGIQRGYGLTEKRFSLFNVSRWGDESVRPACCHVVPTLYVGEFDTHVVNEVLDTLSVMGSVAAPGFDRPEGVVVFHTASGHLYKKTIERDDVPKSLINR